LRRTQARHKRRTFLRPLFGDDQAAANPQKITEDKKISSLLENLYNLVWCATRLAQL
jgi:hypothetical protein